MRCYSVFDSAVATYSAPMVYRTNAQAIRDFSSMANDDKSPLSAHPGDFTLFCLAEFDETSGLITPLKAFENLGTALQYRSTEV